MADNSHGERDRDRHEVTRSDKAVRRQARDARVFAGGLEMKNGISAIAERESWAEWSYSGGY